jgi:TM2 domain-containing protein
VTRPHHELAVPYPISPHSRAVALALAATLGVFGAHRFYTGRIGSGILQAVTLGGLGFWWLYDLIIVASGNFRDDDGRRVVNWDPTDLDDRYGELPPAVAAELGALRAELDELHERLDFTERLLARLPSSAGEDRS